MNISSRPTSIAPMQSVRQVAPLTRTPDPVPEAPPVSSATALTPPTTGSKGLSTSKLIESFESRIESISDQDLGNNAADVEAMEGFNQSGIDQGIKDAGQSQSSVKSEGEAPKELSMQQTGSLAAAGAGAVVGVLKSSAEIGLAANKLRKDTHIKASDAVAEEASSLEDKAELHNDAATGLQKAASILEQAEDGELPSLELDDEDDIETIDTLNGMAADLHKCAASLEAEADELEDGDEPDEDRISELRGQAKLCQDAATVLTDYAIGDREALEDNDQGDDFAELAEDFTSHSQTLERQSTSKNLESQGLRELGKEDRWANGIELSSSALSLGSSINSTVNFANKVTEATHNGIGFLGKVSDVTSGAAGSVAASGAIGIVSGSIEIATTSVDIHQSRKRRDAAKNMLEPTQENLDKAVASLHSQADKLDEKAKSALEGGRFTKPNPEKAAKLEKMATELRARAAEYEAKGPVELSSKDVEDIAKHIKANQKLTFKALKIAKAVLTVAAGVLAIVALTAVAVTPVGWAIAGVAAAAGIGLGIYKLCKSRADKKAIAKLDDQLNRVNAKLKMVDPDSHAAKELKEIKAGVESALTQRSPKFAATKLLTTMQETDDDGDPTEAAEEATRLAVDVLGMNPEQLTSIDPNVAVNMIMKKMGTG